MKKNLTEIVFILDRSGSMYDMTADTIGGYNGFLAKQKLVEGEALISTVLFDDECNVLHDRVDIRRVEPLTEKDYYVGGCTALLDAVGGAIHHMGNVHRYARPEDRPEKTIFVIITDGYENASKRYTYPRVRQMVKRQQEKYQWEFIFLGANMDAAEEAGHMGIRPERAMSYCCDTEGTRANYEAMDQVVRSYRSKACACEADLDIVVEQARKSVEGRLKK